MLRSPHDSMDSLLPYFDALYRERLPVIDARSSFVRIERAGWALPTKTWIWRALPTLHYCITQPFLQVAVSMFADFTV